MTHSHAKQAQGVSDAMVRAAYEDWIDPVRGIEPSWDELPESHKDRLRSSIVAAIGAGGQAVAWRYRGYFHDKTLPWQHTDQKWLADRQAKRGEEVEPLYAHPSPSLPLKEEVERVLREAGCTTDDGTFVHASTRQVADALSRLRVGAQEGWRHECATDGCFKHATVRFERGDVGSYYCHDCYIRIQALAPSPGAKGGRS